MRRIRNSSTKLIMQAQTLAQVEGADIIVAQGTEDGGHGGVRATLPLAPAVIDIAADVMVVAAGGIVDVCGLAAALMLGASGDAAGSQPIVSSHELLNPDLRAHLNRS